MTDRIDISIQKSLENNPLIDTPSKRAEYWANLGMVEVAKTYIGVANPSEEEKDNLLKIAHMNAAENAQKLSSVPNGFWSDRSNLGKLVHTMGEPGGLHSEKGAGDYLFNSLESLSGFLREITRQKDIENQANLEVADFLLRRIGGK